MDGRLKPRLEAACADSERGRYSKHGNLHVILRHGGAAHARGDETHSDRNLQHNRGPAWHAAVLVPSAPDSMPSARRFLSPRCSSPIAVRSLSASSGDAATWG